MISENLTMFTVTVSKWVNIYFRPIFKRLASKVTVNVVRFFRNHGIRDTPPFLLFGK